MKLIIKIGGSTLFDGDDIRVELIQKWINLISNLREQGHQIGVVIGGGKPARKFSKVAKKLGASNSFQDLLGIEAARQNARLFIAGLPDAYPNPPSNYQELLEISALHDLVILGGFQPGQSTNAVAAVFAEHMKADFLFNISDIEKVYSSDPSLNKDAEPYDEIDYGTFANLVHELEQLPGTYDLFDHIGVDIVTRSKIKLVFIDGNHPEYVLDVLKGQPRGTIVK